MTLKEFNKQVLKNTALRTTVPLNMGMIYPRFTVYKETLCVHFLCCMTQQTEEGLLIYPAGYYLQFTYPQAKLLTLRNLAYDSTFADNDMQPVRFPRREGEEKLRYREAVKRLGELGDAVFAAWDAGEPVEALIDEYHKTLESVQELFQTETYRKLLGVD